MAFPDDIDVLDAAGNPQQLRTPNANGRAPAAGSRPVAVDNEAYAEFVAIKTATAATKTNTDSIKAATEGTRSAAELTAGNVAATNALLSTPALQLPPQPLLGASGLTRSIIAKTTAGDTNLIAAGAAGVKNRVHRLKFTVSGATLVTIKLDGGATLDTFRFPATGGFIVLEYQERPWYESGAAQAIIIHSTNAVNIDGSVEYVAGP